MALAGEFTRVWGKFASFLRSLQSPSGVSAEQAKGKEGIMKGPFMLLVEPLHKCTIGGEQSHKLCRLHAAALQIRCASSVTNIQPKKQSILVVREFYGCMRQVKTSPMKLNLVAKLIRGMSIGEALAQMEFSQKKAAKFVQMTLLDTQRRAVHNHDVKPLNLWVAESYVGKGHYLKRIRYHGRGMSGIMHKYYAHYFLKLREGPPPPKKKRSIEDHKSRKTKKLIEEGPKGIPNAL